MTSSARQWWRRAAAAMKDKRSLYITRVAGRGQHAEMEAAVIRATSHDERSLDYKNAARVFAWARTSPTCLSPLMRSLSRRASRTRSWAVALKALLLVHGVVICSPAVPRLGRLPFDLSDFRDSSARSGFCAFVRAYFHFLDHRSDLLSSAAQSSKPENGLALIVKMQELLDLLMQIRPYADGMEVGLILEAMDCVVIEIFEAYSSICSGMASFLVNVLCPSSSSKARTTVASEEQRRMGIAGIRVLRRAAEQSEQLSSYLNLCRALGVHNATEIPPVDTIPEEDIRDLEALVLGGVPGMVEEETYPREEEEEAVAVAGLENEKKKIDEPSHRRLGTVVTEEWEVFGDETAAVLVKCSVNPFLCLENESKPVVPPSSSWATSVYQSAAVPVVGGNLIDLI